MRRSLRWTTLLALALAVSTAAGAAAAATGTVGTTGTTAGRADTDNQTLPEPGSFRRARGKERSTSSSSGEKAAGGDGGDDDDDEKDSLEIDDSPLESESDAKKKKKYIPESSADRTGWRKWHRKCTQCPDDMAEKWRSHSIQWVCGGYQRARRSFKSMCMMRLRNCQDGTMFVKIHNHRCSNDVGDHFFYDYVVKVTDETSVTSESDEKTDSNTGTVNSDFSIDFNDLGRGFFTKNAPLR